jgi:hypothetical protein
VLLATISKAFKKSVFVLIYCYKLINEMFAVQLDIGTLQQFLPDLLNLLSTGSSLTLVLGAPGLRLTIGTIELSF